jgi:hypothetical protein
MEQNVFGEPKLTPPATFPSSFNLLNNVWGIKLLNLEIFPERSTISPLVFSQMTYKTIQDSFIKDNVFNQLSKILNKENISVTDSDFILGYLTNYPKLLDIINNLCNDARKVFGPESLISLRKHQELDSIESYPVIYIKTEKGNSVTLIRKILRKHVYSFLNKDDGWITIRIDQ